MTLSVVVVSYRSQSTLGTAIQSVREQCPSAQLVVIDNSASDAEIQWVESAWPGAIAHANRVNRGFAAAANQGFSLATGHPILLLNPDAELQPGAVNALEAALEQAPNAGIVAPRLLTSAGTPVLSCYPFLSLSTVAWRHFQLYRFWPDIALGRYRRETLGPQAAARIPVKWAQGACLLIRRVVLEQLGGFDERFFLYCEEVDLCLRAARSGWLTYYVPSAVVRHTEGTSTAQVVPLKLASHYFSKLLYFDKHRGTAQTSLLRTMLLVDLGLRSVARAVGTVVGRPPDARLRLAAYGRIAHVLATARASAIQEKWREEGEQTR